MLGPNLLVDNVCLEKAILSHLGGGSEELGFQLYIKYFNKFCLTHSDSNIFACKARLKSEKSVRKALFNKSGDRRPAYFDCSNIQVFRWKKYLFLGRKRWGEKNVDKNYFTVQREKKGLVTFFAKNFERFFLKLAVCSLCLLLQKCFFF